MSTSTAPTIDSTTVLSLFAVLVLLTVAYTASLSLLPPNTTRTLRALYIWHVFDSLIHLLFEGSYLYNCFCSSASASLARIPTFLPIGASFLNQADLVYGAEYGTGATGALWREYARADKRWAGTDLTVISLEVLTVFIGGPLAFYVSEIIRRGDGQGRGKQAGKLWFWAMVLATGELYGGFLTFMPEWLTGSVNLSTEHWMHLWVYLVFFNTLWVWIPLWVLVVAYKRIGEAFGGDPRGKKRV